jgi:K+-sensing histidine kinase KdpD
MAMAHIGLATTLEQANVAEETERLRSALLPSVSALAASLSRRYRFKQTRV